MGQKTLAACGHLESFSVSQEMKTAVGPWSCSGRKHAFRLGVPPPKSCAWFPPCLEGTPVSSNSKEPLLWDTVLQGSYRRNNTEPKGLGIMSLRIAGKHRDASSRDKRPFPYNSKACLTKTRAGCFAERRAHGVATSGQLEQSMSKTCQPEDVLRIRAVCLVREQLAVPGKYASRSSMASCQWHCRWGSGTSPDLRTPSYPKILMYLLQGQIHFFSFLSRL